MDVYTTKAYLCSLWIGIMRQDWTDLNPCWGSWRVYSWQYTWDFKESHIQNCEPAVIMSVRSSGDHCVREFVLLGWRRSKTEAQWHTGQVVHTPCLSLGSHLSPVGEKTFWYLIATHRFEVLDVQVNTATSDEVLLLGGDSLYESQFGSRHYMVMKTTYPCASFSCLSYEATVPLEQCPILTISF